MPNFPLISVIIPVYNVEKYLEKCLDSVVSQTLKDIEIICVNDGSTDSSLSILKTYSEKDNRIQIISRTNKGLGATRNDGIWSAKGEYLFFLDSDDWIDETCLEKLYNKAKADQAELCIYGCIPYDDEKRQCITSKYYTTDIYQRCTSTPCNYKQITDCIFTRFEAVLKLWKRDFFIDNKLFFSEGVWFEDVISHVKGMILAKRITFVNECLYFYRQRKGSTTKAVNNKKIFDAFVSFDSVMKFLKNKNLFDNLKLQYQNFITTQYQWHLGRLNGQLKKRFKSQMNEFLKKNKLKLSERIYGFSFCGWYINKAKTEYGLKIFKKNFLGYKDKIGIRRLYFFGICIGKYKLKKRI